MEVKEYLQQISRLDRMIKDKMQEIAQFRSLLNGISAIRNEERVQTSSDHDKIGGSVAKILEMEEELDRIIDEYVDKKRIIVSQIDSMENELHYDVLFSRYVEKKKFECIALEMQYSYRQIIRIHGDALRDFDEKYHEYYR